jgi:hypothetical protein
MSTKDILLGTMKAGGLSSRRMGNCWGALDHNRAKREAAASWWSSSTRGVQGKQCPGGKSRRVRDWPDWVGIAWRKPHWRRRHAPWDRADLELIRLQIRRARRRLVLALAGGSLSTPRSLSGSPIASTATRQARLWPGTTRALGSSIRSR